MQKYLTNSIATYGTGQSSGKRLFKVTSGQYAGRVVALIQISPTAIALTYADYPYNNWSSVTSIISDCDDYPFDAVMDSDNNIYLVYTLFSERDLVVRKLTYINGSWSAGSLNTIYNGDDNYYPSITIQSDGRLWVSWSRLVSTLYYAHAKYSDDEGVTWMSGSADDGFDVSSGDTSAYSKTLVMGAYVYVIYTLGGTKICYRRKHTDAELFDDETDIAAGTGFDSAFDAAVSSDNRLSVVFDYGKISYREFDGESWGGLYDIDENGGDFPQVIFYNNNPYVIYLSDFGNDQVRILFSRKSDGTFSTPTLLDSGKTVFYAVLCYNAIAAGYENLTAAAANDTTGDIYHTDSGALIAEKGDALYVGLSSKFNYLKIVLSTAGSGGVVSWQYYNGTDWINFTPSGGNYSFSDGEKELLLWSDYFSMPGDWQKNSIEGEELYWLRAVVSTSFTIDPIGSQISAISNAKAIVLMET